MNEVKPEDVMRALECCSSEITTRENCSACPMGGKRDCMTMLYRNALALLREKDAEITNLTCIAEYQQSSNMKRWFELQEKDKQIKEKDAEIKRLKSCVNFLKKYDKERDIRLHARLTEKARAEAITEFEERVKERAVSIGDIHIVYVETIDQIAKEMKGEQDGR